MLHTRHCFDCISPSQVEHVQRLLAEEKAEQEMAAQLLKARSACAADSSSAPGSSSRHSGGSSSSPPRVNTPPSPLAEPAPAPAPAGRRKGGLPVPKTTLQHPPSRSMPPPPPPPPPPQSSSPPAALPVRGVGAKGTGKGDNKENRRAAKAAAVEGRQAELAVFDAHRQFITSCVGQLEVHTYMLSQESAFPMLALDARDAKRERAIRIPDTLSAIPCS